MINGRAPSVPTGSAILGTGPAAPSGNRSGRTLREPVRPHPPGTGSGPVTSSSPNREPVPGTGPHPAGNRFPPLKGGTGNRCGGRVGNEQKAKTENMIHTASRGGARGAAPRPPVPSTATTHGHDNARTGDWFRGRRGRMAAVSAPASTAAPDPAPPGVCCPRRERTTALGGMRTATGDPAPACVGRHRVPERAEQLRLRSAFGAVLRLERGHWTQQQLADAAGLDRRTVDRMENGQRRPSTVSVWKIARALRPGDSMRDRVALDERLRRAAGPSLVYANTRPHVARERVRGELLAEAAGGPVATAADSCGALILAGLAAGAAAADDGDHDD